MLLLFEYNWQVRNDWFEWCKQMSNEELFLQREGGVGSFLRTLFHIVDVEQAWIRGLQGRPEFHYHYDEYASLYAIRDLSHSCRPEVEQFVRNWSKDLEKCMLDEFTYGEVIRHIIAHEIHHVGQMSVWARSLGHKPVSANLIGRGLAKGL